MIRPDIVTAWIGKILGQPVSPSDIGRVHGGDISPAFRVRTPERELFLKIQPEAPEGFFAAEARGLRTLREALEKETRTCAIVPEVYAHADKPFEPPYIRMEYLPPAPRRPDFDQILAESIAIIHRVTDHLHGLDFPTFCGKTPQPNARHSSWSHFFIHRRLEYQIDLLKKHRLPFEPFAELFHKKKPRIQAELPEIGSPSLLHGDLWSGNVLSSGDGVPALIDPAIYFGDPETDIAFSRLFGGFSPGFYRAYFQIIPPSRGSEIREKIYNLYHLLNHANLFHSNAYLQQAQSLLSSI